MSYCLELYFEPSVQRRRIFEYFAARQHFSIVENDAFYRNSDTGVDFRISFEPARKWFVKTIVSAEFEVNYCRPGYFGTEAEKELSAFIAAFPSQISDPQINGMDEGPCSAEGFLNGWNFGNRYSVGQALSHSPDLASMPADTLRASWEWNYARAERDRLTHRFVPTIMFFVIEGRPRRVAVWPRGMPILLPRVDNVLIGRLLLGEKRFGLASWSEILEVARRAGFDTTKDPLDLEYLATPPPIAQWVANIPLIDLDPLERLAARQILDEEVIAAARDV